LSNLTALSSVISFEDLQDILKVTDYVGYPVVGPESNLVGYVSRKDLKVNLLPSLKISFEVDGGDDPYTLNLSHIVDRTPLAVDPSVPIEFVIDIFKKIGVSVIIVKKFGKLCGYYVLMNSIITKKDIIALLADHEHIL
jgi:CBS domain-containing protein